MRIDSNHALESATESADLTNVANLAAGRSSGWGVNEDQAQLSGTHMQAEALTSQASQTPEVREERVSALRQAVQSGQYQTSPESVAGAMLNHMLASSFA